MLHIAICEDEKLYGEELEGMIYRYLTAHGLSCEIDAFDSDSALMEKEAGLVGYDVVFLDVNKKGIDGLETARWIRQYSETLFLVFVAESEHYAIEGYKVNANWYLLKDSENFEVDFQECMETVAERKSKINIELTFKFREGLKVVETNRILYLESVLHMLTVYVLEDGVIRYYTMYEKLDVMEKRLPKSVFCRVHKSYLVNLKHVGELKRYEVIMCNGQRLNVAKRRYKEAEKKYLTFNGIVFSNEGEQKRI